MSDEPAPPTTGEDERLWRESDVTLATTTGDQVLRAIVHPKAPGLAVTMHHFGSFDVTHIKSGKKIAGPYGRCGRAMLTLAEFSRCFDWTQDAAGIAAQLAEKGELPVPFSGHTITQEGRTRPQTIAEYAASARNWIFSDEFPWEAPADDPGECAFDLLNGSEPEPAPGTPT